MDNERKPDVRNAIWMSLARTGSSWTNMKSLQDSLKYLNLSMEGTDDLIRENQENPEKGIVWYADPKAGDLFTVPKVYSEEKRIAENVIRIKYSRPKISAPEDSIINRLISEAENETGKHLCDEQADAVRKAMKDQIMILTGGPGTGKTCTLNTIDRCLRRVGYTNIQYAAPTGKAARRVTESTGKPAATLHKMIHITKEQMKPQLLSGEVIIVDEISMLDMDVADAFFRAVPDGMKLILVGDTDQLPSVGKGAVLRDIIASGIIPVAKLVKTFRQSNDSVLFGNIQKIRSGDASLDSGADFHIAVPNEKYSAVDELIAIYMSEYERLGGNDDLCLLTPFRQKKFASSSEALNEKLQQIINPDGLSVEGRKNEFFRKGDPVIQTENRMECANGDVGRVVDVTHDMVEVQYTGNETILVQYKPEELHSGQLNLAYAMSIHKSQGSEYKSVITTILKEHSVMLQRNLIYTAVTRAKQNCFLVCEEEAVERAVKNVADSGRITKLSEWLRREDMYARLGAVS